MKLIGYMLIIGGCIVIGILEILTQITWKIEDILGESIKNAGIIVRFR